MDNKDTKSDYKKLLRGYPNILTVPEVAEILSCSTKTIYRQIKRNELETFRFGRSLRISKTALSEYLERCAQISDNSPV